MTNEELKTRTKYFALRIKNWGKVLVLMKLTGFY